MSDPTFESEFDHQWEPHGAHGMRGWRCSRCRAMIWNYKDPESIPNPKMLVLREGSYFDETLSCSEYLIYNITNS